MYDHAHGILTREEMLTLVKKAKKGCKDSEETIIKHNVRLVETVMKPYIPFAEKDELMQEGIIGVCEAVEKFDLTKDTAFSTYAMIRIKKRIRYFLKENRTIKIPHWVYAQENIEELKKTTAPMSLNKIFADGIEQIELIGNHDNAIKKMENRDVLERLFERLDEREKYVIIEIYSENKTLVEIAEKLGVSREWARQIKCSALNKMKKRGIEDELKFKRFI